MLTLQWKADNPIDNQNGTLYYRIDFDTPTINMDSRFFLLVANYLPPPGYADASSEVPEHLWYDILIPERNIVGNNVRYLLNFITSHEGTSNEYIHAFNLINNLRGGAGILDGGKKKKRKQSISRKPKNKLRISKRIKRRSKSIKSIKRKLRHKY